MQQSAEASIQAAAPPPHLPPAAPGRLALFLGFSQISLSGFGGVLPFAYRGLVEKRGWLTATEFAAMLASSQALPGPSICNLSLLVGWRFGGVGGALASLAGMLGGPLIVIILLGLFYQRFGELAPIRAALGGMAAVATGLIAATAIKMALPLLREQNSRKMHLLLALLAFAGMGLLRFPMIGVIATLAPLGIALCYWRDR